PIRTPASRRPCALLPSPTRRSSALQRNVPLPVLAYPSIADGLAHQLAARNGSAAAARTLLPEIAPRNAGRYGLELSPGLVSYQRSEEHTSELQSREKLVCRLLPEKK